MHKPSKASICQALLLGAPGQYIFRRFWEIWKQGGKTKFSKNLQNLTKLLGEESFTKLWDFLTLKIVK